MKYLDTGRQWKAVTRLTRQVSEECILYPLDNVTRHFL